MNLNVLITPAGRLQIEQAPDSLPEVSDDVASQLERAFTESSAAGLVLLASHELHANLPAAFVFWRALARRFFQAVCQQGESGFDKWGSIPAPAEDELNRLIAEAPPMRG